MVRISTWILFCRYYSKLYAALTIAGAFNNTWISGFRTSYLVLLNLGISDTTPDPHTGHFLSPEVVMVMAWRGLWLKEMTRRALRNHTKKVRWIIFFLKNFYKLNNPAHRLVNFVEGAQAFPSSKFTGCSISCRSIGLSTVHLWEVRVFEGVSLVLATVLFG